jgi:hypothetical protein
MFGARLVVQSSLCLERVAFPVGIPLGHLGHPLLMQHDLLDLARKSTIDFDDLRKNKPSFLLGISPASHG